MASSDCHKTGEESSPKEQQQRVWSSVCAHTTASCPESSNRDWPTYDIVLSDVANSDYNDTLECPHDVRHGRTRTKALCAFGVAACCKLELFPIPNGVSPYTGLFTPDNTLEHCIIRLSSAIKPPASESTSTLAKLMLLAAGEKARKAKLFPTAAIKVFRGGSVQSGNLLFGGCKVGQHEEDYFAHCMATQMTSRMPRTLRPFVRKFWQYSQHPLSLGVSDVCAFDENGEPPSQANFPFAIILSPCRQSKSATTEKDKASNEKDAFDMFLDEALEISAGTVLFDVFACPHPAAVSDPTMLQRIGRIVTTSEMVHSSPHDGLFFRHQRKEEDYELRPGWKRHLKTKCVLEDGSVGTVEHLAGWELFEEQIGKGSYIDFKQRAIAS